MKKSQKDEQFYELIDNTNFLLDTTFVDFSRVESLYDIINKKEGFIPKILYYGIDSDKRCLSVDIDIEDFNIPSIEISEMDDSWYLVVIKQLSEDGKNRLLYKCDQYDGLLDLLIKYNIITDKDIN